MKIQLLLLLLSLSLCVTSMAQPSTEIYVFNLNESNGTLTLSNPVNVSNNNPGYDNQPAFLENGQLLYVATRNGLTDVVLADLVSGERRWLTDTPGGGEYSPTPIPGETAFSAIRLDSTGLQRLYSYDFASGKSDILVNEVVIGYHAWIGPHHVAAFVLDEPPTLQICDTWTGECRRMEKDIGRSLHLIPGSELLSYVDKSVTPWEIRSMNTATGESSRLIASLPESEDHTWTPGAVLLSGKGSILYKFDPERDSDWIRLADLSEFGLSGITRLAVDPQGRHLAVVAEGQ